MNLLPHIQPEKLYPPQARPSDVPRPRLAKRLSAGLNARLTVVAAPAGFGKSSLIGQWRAANPSVPMAWVSLDADDNDPVRFWSHAALAVDRAAPGVGEGALTLLASESVPPKAVARSIRERAVGLTEEIVLALDDFHLISSQDVIESLLPLLEEGGSRLHLWLVTRADPALPLARLRARQELLELRADDLRFQPEEAAALLNGAHGLVVPDEWAATLTARTEGWVTALQLAAISLQGRRDPTEFIRAFAGSHRHIVDYLSEEVLAGLAPRTRSFLLETAILERMTGDLCDAVTGATDGQAMLEGLERAGLFLIPLDEERRWYRYHHLFADVLRMQGRRSDQEGGLARHRRAAQWLIANGYPEEAMGHALAAGETDWAATWLETLVGPAGSRPGVMATLKLVESIPRTVWTARPVLALAYAGALYQAGQYEKMVEALSLLPRPHEDKHLGQILSLEAGAAFYRGDWDATADLCRQALEKLPPADLDARARLWDLLTAALTFRGDLEEAARSSDQAIAVTMQAGSPVDLLTALSARAGIAEARGALRQAIASMSDALERARPLGLHGMIMVDLGQLRQKAGDLAAAWQVLSEGTKLCREIGLMTWVAFGELRLAHVAQARGDAALADVHLARAAEVARETRNPSFATALADMQGLLALLRGNLPAAEAWAELVSGPVSGERALILARVRLAGGRPAEALAMLERLREHPEMLIWRAVACLAAGDETGALAAASRGVPWAETEGYRQVIAEAGEPLARLRARLNAKPPTGLVEELTEREWEILKLIAAGASNQEIASRLFLAVPTVKRHVSGVLAKLGASSRTHVVALAREKGIL